MAVKQNKNTKKQKTIKAVAKIQTQNIAENENNKPYATANEMLTEILYFSTKFNALKGIVEKEDYFKEVKQRLALSVKQIEHPLLEVLTKEKWNDSEYLGLLFAIGLYVSERKALSLDILFQFANMNILKLEEIIKVFAQRESKLIKEDYFNILPGRSSFFLDNKIISMIMGNKSDAKKETPKKPAPKNALNPVLKSVRSICGELDKYIVGQEKAKKVLATALFEHILRIRLKEKGSKSKFDKKNVLLLGPTGSGKTYLCQILAKIANIPFVMSDSTQYSATGYVGGDVQDIIYNLAQTTHTKEGGTIPLSIVFIDEFDKLRFSKDQRGFDMTRKVQDSLLKMLESEKFYLQSRFSSACYDISKVLFVASGAFSDLEESSKETKSIGFTTAVIDKKDDIDVSKIAKYGFLPEILGRLTYRVCVDKLNKEELTDILTKVEDNPIQQYSELYKECGRELVVPTDKIDSIVDKALSEGTGARGLSSILGEYLREELANMQLPEDALTAN